MSASIKQLICQTSRTRYVKYTKNKSSEMVIENVIVYIVILRAKLLSKACDISRNTEE